MNVLKRFGRLISNPGLIPKFFWNTPLVCNNKQDTLYLNMNCRIMYVCNISYRLQLTILWDVRFLPVFRCRPVKQIRRKNDKTPLLGTSWAWSSHRSSIFRQFYEMQSDNPRCQIFFPQLNWFRFLRCSKCNYL